MDEVALQRIVYNTQVRLKKCNNKKEMGRKYEATGLDLSTNAQEIGGTITRKTVACWAFCFGTHLTCIHACCPQPWGSPLQLGETAGAVTRGEEDSFGMLLEPGGGGGFPHPASGAGPHAR